MTPIDLKSLLAATLHRSDLTFQMDNFINQANQRINSRFGVALVVPADTEPLPGPTLLYFYGAMNAAYIFLNNGDSAQLYDEYFMAECDISGSTLAGTSLDSQEGIPPIIQGVS